MLSLVYNLNMLNKEEKEDLIFQYVEVLRDVRKSHGLTQVALAEACGLNCKYVTHIEQRYRCPSLQSLILLLSTAGASRRTALNLAEEFIDGFDWERD